MRTIIFTVLGHLVAVALLFALGTYLNDAIKTNGEAWAGLTTVFSVAFGIYSFVVSALYQRNRRFHFWINRLWLRFVRTHTYWQPSFDLELSSHSPARNELLGEIWEALSHGRLGQARRSNQTAMTLTVELDELLCLVFRVSEGHLHAQADRKLLVPSHLYDVYRAKLARLAEDLHEVVKPAETRYGLTVSFGDGVSNPYYGFFVNQVPLELLQEFHVTFRPEANSSCRIEAEKDRVSIEGSSRVDFFETLREVLALRGLPGAAS